MSSLSAGNEDGVSSELLQGLTDQTKRIYVDASYSGKAHLDAAAKWQKWNTRLGIPATVASSFLAAGAAVSALINGYPWVTASLAGAAAVLNGLRSFLQPEVKAQAHGLKGNQYLALRSDAQTFLEIDLRAGFPKNQLVNAMKDLRRRYNDLIQTDPQLTDPGAYASAKRGIEAGEANYTNDPLWQELGD
jgi:hypothetical protein